MSNNLDIDAFRAGYKAEMQKTAGFNGLKGIFNATTAGSGTSGASLGSSMGSSLGGSLASSFHKHFSAGGGGIRDQLYNKAVGTGGQAMADVIKTPEAQKAINESANSAAQNVLNDFQKKIGWDPSKPWGQNLSGLVQNHPIMAALGAGGILAGGYGLGKMTGLIGGGSNQPTNNQQNNNAAYTNGYRPPQALTKASSTLPILDSLNVKVPDIAVPKLIGTPAMVGLKAYELMDTPEEQPMTRQVNISSGNNKARAALKSKEMQDYLSNLVRRSQL